MKTIRNVDDIADQYSKRILSNIIGKDPMKVLERTPRRLRKLVKGLKKKQLRYQYAPGKWSIAQIVNHLADAELTGAFRLRMMVSQAGSPILAYDQNAWANTLHYDRSNVDEKVELFAAVRKSQLEIWDSLNESDWEKFGLHSERGKETVERFAQLHAGHDINHLNQIRAIRKMFGKNRKK